MKCGSNLFFYKIRFSVLSSVMKCGMHSVYIFTESAVKSRGTYVVGPSCNFPFKKSFVNCFKKKNVKDLIEVGPPARYRWAKDKLIVLSWPHIRDGVGQQFRVLPTVTDSAPNPHARGRRWSVSRQHWPTAQRNHWEMFWALLVSKLLPKFWQLGLSFFISRTAA